MKPVIPRISEKAYVTSQSLNTYVFVVPADMNKHEISQAVTTQFGVTVENVRTVVQTGKAVRYIRKGGRMNKGSRQDMKKAYVTLKQGDTIPVFASLADEENESKGPGKGTK